MRATKYDYPETGAYNETTATMEDGRVLYIDAQHECVFPASRLDGIDVAALIADARINGKFGVALVAVQDAPMIIEEHGTGWCDKCESYCWGDCNQS